MAETETIRTRIKIMDSILLEVLKSHALSEEWEDLSKRVSKRARDRNIIVHTQWAYSEDLPDGLIENKKDFSQSFWVEKDFLDAYERINGLLVFDESIRKIF